MKGVGRNNFNQVETKDHYDLVIHCANSEDAFINTHPEEDKEAIFVTTSETESSVIEFAIDIIIIM